MRYGTAPGGMVGIAPIMHSFWARSDPLAQQMQMIMFFKNLAMLAGPCESANSALKRGTLTTAAIGVTKGKAAPGEAACGSA